MFLTSRVHPGESNASWVMKGQYLGSCRIPGTLSEYVNNKMEHPTGVEVFFGFVL